MMTQRPALKRLQCVSLLFLGDQCIMLEIFSLATLYANYSK